jgi:hypothetical protein
MEVCYCLLYTFYIPDVSVFVSAPILGKLVIIIIIMLTELLLSEI